MKKIILLLAVLTFFATVGFAQTSDQQACIAGLELRLTKEHAAYEAKDYAAAELACLDILDYFNGWSEELRNMYKEFESHMYYELACVRSLGGKCGAAVESFAAACDRGFDAYRHVANDADMDNIRDDATFRRLHAAMRNTSDYIYILQRSPEYAANERPDTLLRFSYMPATDPDLVRVREYFKLDSVAGSGDELSKIRRILTFVHDKIRHDGSSPSPDKANSIAFAECCKNGSRGLNCRGLATVLNECYLAMGFKSRFVTCMPRKYINDCHVINMVYSDSLSKWLWVDPTNNAWVMDENGVMLGISEVRERLRDGRPLVLNDEANWNNRRKVVKEEYLDVYMAKNLYWMNCSDRSEFGTEEYVEGRPEAKFVALYPSGFESEYRSLVPLYVVSDDEWFWQKPDK